MLAIRKYRIFGLAIFDLVTAMIGLTLLFLLARWKHFPKLSVWPFVAAGVLLAIPLGMVFHILFGVNTKLNYDLGLSNAPKR